MWRNNSTQHLKAIAPIVKEKIGYCEMHRSASVSPRTIVYVKLMEIPNTGPKQLAVEHEMLVGWIICNNEELSSESSLCSLVGRVCLVQRAS